MANAPIRPAAVAGSFYPSDARVLQTMVGDLLARALPLEAIPPPKALIAPHAGYIYSGAVAASAYASLKPLREQIEHIVLLGPNHRVALEGMALPAAQSFETPLGKVAVDRERWLALQQRPYVVVDDAPHALEHSLEVHLPFLQAIFERFTLTPLVVGSVSPARVAELIDALWGGPETLIVISSDLSHYQPYHQAQWCDRATADQILRLEPKLNHQQACGATPVNGLLLAAAQRRLEPHLLDLRNSGDTSGDRDRVVGYASVGFCEGEPDVRH